MRIGTNHGSLSDRIMNRYGDTPLGMVESAMEFIRICESNNFNQIVLSMKSSNPIVMVHAYRLLVNKMNLENMHYPLHIRVFAVKRFFSSASYTQLRTIRSAWSKARSK